MNVERSFFFNLSFFNEVGNFCWDCEVFLLALNCLWIHGYWVLKHWRFYLIQILKFGRYLNFVGPGKGFNSTNGFKEIFAIFDFVKNFTRNFWFYCIFLNHLAKVFNEVPLRFQIVRIHLTCKAIFIEPYFAVLSLVEHDHLSWDFKKSEAMAKSLEANHRFL